MRSGSRWSAALILAVGAGCTAGPGIIASLPVEAPATCEVAGHSIGAPVVDTLATGLEVPWGIAEAPDGRLFVTERAGRIRVIRDGRLDPEPWAELPASHISSGEGGLMGIALDPDSGAGFVYVVGTFSHSVNPATRLARRLMRWVDPLWAPGYVNRVVRFREQDGRGVEPRILIDHLPSSIWMHAGADLAFGPDGMLYVSLGDAGHPPSARDPGSPNGAILRYRPDGSLPADNPDPASPVYAYGLRNVQGLDWHPATGELFAVEHGPTGLGIEDLRFGQDELNRIVPGGDYGWPVVAGRGGDVRFHDPLAVWHPVFAPARVRFGPGGLYVTALRGLSLQRLVLDPPATGDGAWAIRCQETVLGGVSWGRFRALAVTRDGSVIVGLSNRDGRGTPRAGDDMILRLRWGSG